jgi:uncharacterized membrane protein
MASTTRSIVTLSVNCSSCSWLILSRMQYYPHFHIAIQVLITKICTFSFMLVLSLYVQFVLPLLQVNSPMSGSMFWFNILPNLGSSVYVFQISFFHYFQNIPSLYELFKKPRPTLCFSVSLAHWSIRWRQLDDVRWYNHHSLHSHSLAPFR